MDFERMRTLRKAKHKSQDDLAKYLGVNRATVSKYETGVIEPSLTQISRIAAFLEVPQSEILGIESFDTPADFEKRWAEITGTPHAIELFQGAGGTSGNWDQTMREIARNVVNAIPLEDLSTEERAVVLAMKKLNPDGKKKAVERVQELTEIPKYQKENPPQD